MNLTVTILVGLASGLFMWTFIVTIQEAFAHFEKKYAAAGEAQLNALYITMTPRQLSKLSLSSGALVTLLFYALGGWLTALVGGILGLFTPLFSLRYLKAARQKKFNEQLIDSLGHISNALRAGHTFPQAIELISQEMKDPLQQEFRIAHSEIRLGQSPIDALKGIAQRVQVSDLDLVVDAVEIAEDLGGNLSQTFDNIANTIRERFRVEGRIHSLSAMGRLQGLVLIAMPFVLIFFLAHFQTEFISPLFTTTQGQIFCGLGFIWLTLGWVSIQKIVNIDV